MLFKSKEYFCLLLLMISFISGKIRRDSRGLSHAAERNRRFHIPKINTCNPGQVIVFDDHGNQKCKSCEKGNIFDVSKQMCVEITCRLDEVLSSDGNECRKKFVDIRLDDFYYKGRKIKFSKKTIKKYERICGLDKMLVLDDNLSINCQSCGEGEKFDYPSKQCIKICQRNEIFDLYYEKCVPECSNIKDPIRRHICYNQGHLYARFSIFIEKNNYRNSRCRKGCPKGSKCTLLGCLKTKKN